MTFGIEEICSLFRRTRGAAAAGGRHVLLRLFAAPAAAAALPWELMLDPDGDRPLALSADVHLVRTAQVRTYPLRTERIAPPINVLLILSNASPVAAEQHDGALFDHYEEGRSLLAELQPLVDRGLLEVTVEDRPSLDSLRRRIGAQPRGFHVIHYLGHARPSGLKLERPDGASTWVESSEIDELLRRGCPDLRLVLFAGCQTAVAPRDGTDGNRRAHSSITDHVVQEACPSVIGMQAVLPFRTEQILARVFYQALCAGRSVAHSVTLARAAVISDEIVGGDLMDWAVPILVTGDVAGPIVDPEAQGVRSAAPPARSQLKLDLEEPDREFFARFGELRQVLDVLTCRRQERVVVLTGGSGVGKSRLLARALDELGSDVGYVLYASAQRLARPSSAGVVDPIATLSSLVCELLGRDGGHPPELLSGWSSRDWWERLVEELVGRSFVLAIEDIDGVTAPVAADLGDAVEMLVQRRSRSRVAMTAHKPPPDLLGRGARYAVQIGVPALCENDVAQWLQRNRPALSTELAHHPGLLSELFRTKLSTRLELWSALGSQLTGKYLLSEVTIRAEADRVLGQYPEQVHATPPPSVDATVVADSPESGAGRKRKGPLRVVTAGPYTAGRTVEFANAIATMAASHAMSGRVVADGGPDQLTSLATLIDTESPFAANNDAVGSEAIVDWLEHVATLDPDIVLLDYGSEEPSDRETAVLQRLSDGGALLVAAGGNAAQPSYPAHLDFVLGVGAVDEKGSARRFSRWFPKVSKPDLYAQDNLANTPLSDAVSQPKPTMGTSFAALTVLAASVLVWAIDRSKTATEVRALLVESATSLSDRLYTINRPRRLDLEAALNAARATVLLSALQLGPLDGAALSVASAIDQAVAEMVIAPLEKFDFLNSNADRYELASDDAPKLELVARSFAASS